MNLLSYPAQGRDLAPVENPLQRSPRHRRD